jgi:methionyl-tRNA formyltransferase
MLINIVTDNKKSWFYSKVIRLAKRIRALSHRVKILSDAAKLPSRSDITFFLSYENYIPRKVRYQSRHNIVIHASDLPRGRGMSPATWQIVAGQKTIPVTLFEVADGFDSGDFYLKDKFHLDGTELIEEWREKLYLCMERMILKFVNNINNLEPLKQRGKISVYPRRTFENSKLDINKSLKSQFNLLRVTDNERYPAFFNHRGNKYILKVYKKSANHKGNKEK